MSEITINFLKLKLFIIVNIILSIISLSNANSSENFIVSTVNKLPITKKDIVYRAQLLSFSIEKKSNFENLKKYYNQSLNSLINEKIILSAGLKINENIVEMITPKANKLLLNQFSNSKAKLNKFINELSIPRAKLLEKYQSQLIWGIVLEKKFKTQLIKLDKISEDSLKNRKKRQSEDLYDLAEIVISRNNNKVLLNQIKSALKRGANFLDLAKQISISSSAKFNGKVGWKNYQNLPNYIKSKKINLNEGDIISFQTKDKIKIIKVLAKRLDGKFSKNEIGLILAQIKFPINFQKKEDAYLKVKNNLETLISNQKSCKNLNQLDEKNKNYNLNIIKSRMADLSSKIQNVTINSGLYEISQPIFFANHGYAHILCDIKKPQSKKQTNLELKNKIMQKHYLIFSEKYLKRLYKEADISDIKNFNK